MIAPVTDLLSHDCYRSDSDQLAGSSSTNASFAKFIYLSARWIPCTHTATLSGTSKSFGHCDLTCNIAGDVDGLFPSHNFWTQSLKMIATATVALYLGAGTPSIEILHSPAGTLRSQPLLTSGFPPPSTNDIFSSVTSTFHYHSIEWLPDSEREKKRKNKIKQLIFHGHQYPASGSNFG